MQAASARQGNTGRIPPGRVLVLAIAPLWLVAVSLFGFSQAPWPDPLAPPGFLSLDWWRYPLERRPALRLPLVGGQLNGLHVDATGRAIWAVGDDGLILHSADGGASWVRQSLESKVEGAAEAQPAAPRATPAKASWWNPLPAAFAQSPAGAQPTAPAKRQSNYERDLIQAPSGGLPELGGGKAANPAPGPSAAQRPAPKAESKAPVKSNAPPQKRPETINGSPAANASQPHDASPAASTPAAGASRPAFGASTGATAPIRPRLEAVFFLPDKRTGWAVGTKILATTDAGAHWSVAGPDWGIPNLAALAGPFGDTWIAVGVSASGEAWLVGRRGKVLYRARDTTQWKERADFDHEVQRALIDPDTGTLLCMTADGQFHRSANGGQSWNTTSVVLYDESHALLHGLALERAGPDYTLRIDPQASNGGALRALVARPDEWFLIVAPASIARFQSADLPGPSRLQWLTLPPAGALHDIRFAADGTGRARGFSEQPYVSRDGGRTWAPESAGYARYPAPWVWLAWFAGFLALGGAALRPPPPPATQISETIADAFASDKPLAAAREDRLDFAPRAWGLSAFLRNERTEAPLTIAITGDWGSGKSSLMGLLREDLRRFGVRSVWFNAWHHQKEEALLAALLSAIRDEAIPGLFSLEGVEYRLRLLWMRGHRYWPLSLAVAFSIGLFGWALAHPGSALDNWFALANDLWRALLGDDKSAPTENDLLAKLRAAGLAVGALAPLATALLRLRAFGVDPGALAASVSRQASIRDLGVQASFRQRFAAEFSEVTAALEPRTMLVLIDDLDRCRPEAVLEVMEAVNFLVSSGRVFVVLGMARERVEACVGLAFEKIAQEMVDNEAVRNGGEEDKDAIARRVRREYARQYLEKLINIEMPMPQLDPGASRQLQDEAPSQTGFEWPAAVRRLSRLWPVAIGLGAIFLGAWLGSQLPAAVSHDPAGASVPAPGAVTTSALAPPATSPAASAPSAEAAAKPAYFAPAAARGGTGALPYGLPLAALMLALLLAALVRRPDPVVKDSPAFREALAIWNPVVAAALRTPRAVKRYQNWVRYLAMMQRATQRTPTLRDALYLSFARLLGRAPEETGGGEPDNSPELVALGALERVLPDGIGSDELADNIARIERAELRTTIRQALDAHAKRFNLQTLQAFLPRFRRLARGVRMEAAPEPPVQDRPAAGSGTA